MRPYRSASHGSKAQDWRSDSFHRGAAAGKPCIDFEPRAGVSYAQQRGPQKSCRRRPRKSRTDLNPREVRMPSVFFLRRGATTCMIVTAALALTTASPVLAQQPAVAEWQFLESSTTPPTESTCYAVGIRCFTPQAMQNAYNIPPLYTQGFTGKGKTIAVIDSFGSSTIANDLNVFSTAFGLPHLCGEAGVTCSPGMPTFRILQVQGSPPPNPPPPSNGTGQESHNLWALEVSLDVEWAHAIAPEADILLVTTPTAEILGVQGFPQMMNAVQYIVDNHLADVISMSLGAGEGTFAGTASLSNLRRALVDAQANHITVLASSGDGGTSNNLKEPTKSPRLIPYPSVEWPASDPLVTAVGGTRLCVDATTGTTVDTT